MKQKDDRLVVRFSDLPPPISKARREWKYLCPYCEGVRGKPDRDGKMLWNPEKQVGSCWKCRTLVLPDRAADMGTLYENYYRPEVKVEKPPQVYALASWSRPATEYFWAKEYLNQRGFTDELIGQYNIRASEIPENCILLPDQWDGQNTNFFQVRYLKKDAKIKYTNPTDADKPVYGLFTAIGKTRSFVCEGCFSSISMNGVRPDWGSLATYGKSPSLEQLRTINALPCIEELCIVHDGGEIKSLLDCLQEFLQTDKTVSFILLPFERDPNDMPRAELERCFNRLKFTCTEDKVSLLRMKLKAERWRDMHGPSWVALAQYCLKLETIGHE